MSIRHSLLLRLAFVATALSACSDNTMTSFPEEDASGAEDGPSFDIPRSDASADVGTADRGTTTDRGTPVDRGTSTVCPASCGASAECDPCRTTDTPPTVAYCCISGLCVSMTGTCPAGNDGGEVRLRHCLTDRQRKERDDQHDPVMRDRQ